MKKKFLFVLFIVFVSQIAMEGLSQNGSMLIRDRHISGRITDASDGNPIPAATVFISNTTIGTTTDTEGNYRLRIPGEGSYQLTVSHVGYQSVFKDIDPGNTSIQFDVALQSIELEELTVATRVRFRRSDINLFWNTILGKNPSRRTIQATNPEAVYYYYNSETRILKVTCREPLQIVNNETGYRIQYVLNYFTHDYNTDITDWGYQNVFTELEPQNQRQKDTWEKNRKELYKISLTKFIKSLYHNSLFNDGFALADFHLTSDPANPYQLSLVNPDNILSSQSTDISSKTLNLSYRQVLLICYGRPVTENDLAKLERSQYEPVESQRRDYSATARNSLSYQSGYNAMPNVSANQSQTDNQSVAGGGLSNSQSPGTALGSKKILFEDNGLIRSLLLGDTVLIFPDGSFSNTLSLPPVNSKNTLMGLSMRLPIDYAPDGATSVATSDAIDESINDFDGIAQHFDRQLIVFPQEKIHLHTDRNMYVPGERIWFKAYLTDAVTHQPATYSRYVYAELIDSHDSLVSRVMVRPENEMFYGHLFLSEIIPEGDYTLRAYTRYMENLGDDYFFKKNIRIGNLTSPQPSPKEKERTGRDDFDVTFFPEGGNLVEGVFCKVAFKALNGNGYSESISGEIIDGNGSVITSVKTFHAGMGVFSYVPESGKRYLLKCQNLNGLEKQFELPQPDPRTYTLNVSQHNNRISVGFKKSPQAPESSCYLLAHCRGTVVYFASWSHENEYIAFAEEELPAGIIQFILFDEQMNPLSERLVFCKNYDEAKPEFYTDKAVYEKRDKVTATLTLSPSLLERTGMSLSVAITDDTDIPIDSSTTILSSLLFSSELKGYIENPDWYLQDHIQSVTALDLLMMTHGWRRYNIHKVVKGKQEFPAIACQTSQEISGAVKSLTRARPVTGSEVLILVNDSKFGLTSTDENGRFMFRDFEYPDSVDYFLRALNNRGSDRVEIVMDGASFPKLVHAPQSPVTKTPVTMDDMKNELESNSFITKAEQRSHYDDDMRVIHLNEMEVTAPRIERKVEPRLQYTLNKSADATIQKEEVEILNYRNTSDYIASILLKYFNKGPASDVIGGPPLILIDGTPLEFDPENPIDKHLQVYEIESFDVFHGIGATVFGVRGANGVISITTKTGDGNSRRERDESNYTVYTPLGYQNPVEFYSPKYETLESKHLTIPDYRTTIFWKPDIVISEDSGKASFEFYTSDFSTTFSVVIEGITADGRIIRQVEKIRVE